MITNCSDAISSKKKVVAWVVRMSQFQDDGKLEGLESSKGWRQFTSGFSIGAFGGDVVAYVLLANIAFFA